MPKVLSALKIVPIEVGVVEAQVTASVDGSFFGVHTDADYDRVPKRYLTYVYSVRMPSGAFADARFTVNGWINSA